MVKKIDESLMPEHVGVLLWTAATRWKAQLEQAMVARGHAWYGDARSAIPMHLDPRGLSQSELVKRMGISKQAVQQLLDSLEAEGIVRREAGDDARSKRVVYTSKGLKALRDAVEVKQQIEARYREHLGKEAYATFTNALRILGGDVAAD